MPSAKPKTIGEFIAEAESVKHDMALAAERAKAQRAEAKLKQAMAHAHNLESQVEHLLGMQGPKSIKNWEAVKRKPSGKATAVLVLSDWHAEENIDPKTINGLNEFTPEICARRVRRVFEKAIEFLDFASRFSKIGELVVAVLGDLINGYIHEELEESNWMSPTEAVLFTEELLASGLALLLKEFKGQIIVPTCFGNHGRTTKRRRVSTGWKNSHEWQLYESMKRHNREPRIAWKVERSYHNWLDVRGKAVRMHHGDSINYWGGVGGVTIPVNKALASWNRSRTADLDIFGHFHAYTPHWSWVLNGALCGYNAYALHIKAEPQPPSQTFLVIDEAQPAPHVLCMPIFCEDHK